MADKTAAKRSLFPPTDNHKKLLEYVLNLTKERKIVFCGAQAEGTWTAVEGSFRFVLTKNKKGYYCLGIYAPGAQAVFLRSSGGTLCDGLTELYREIQWAQEDLLAPKLLKELEETFKD